MNLDKFRGNLNIRLNQIKDHIRMDYEDIISYPKQIQMIDTIYALYQSTNVNKFIINTKGCPVEYSITERHKVAVYLTEKFQNKLLVACIVDTEQITGIVEDTSRNRAGYGLKMVTTEEDALKWIEQI